ARSTASLMAMPRLPVLSGFCSRMARPEGGLRAGAGDAARAIGLHQGPAIGLLVIADAHHEDLDLEAEERAREGKGGTPLPRAGLGRQAPHPLGLVVEGL